jgi:hypothetical protein
VLALEVVEAEDLHMTPRSLKHRPTAGALRAARAIQQDASTLNSLPELIDRETGIREVLEILEAIIAEAGDLVEGRSPELVAEARAALRRYNDETARQAE